MNLLESTNLIANLLIVMPIALTYIIVAGNPLLSGFSSVELRFAILTPFRIQHSEFFLMTLVSTRISMGGRIPFLVRTVRLPSVYVCSYLKFVPIY